MPSSHDAGAGGSAARHMSHVICTSCSWSTCRCSSGALGEAGVTTKPCGHGLPACPTQRSVGGAKAARKAGLYRSVACAKNAAQRASPSAGCIRRATREVGALTSALQRWPARRRARCGYGAAGGAAGGVCCGVCCGETGGGGTGGEMGGGETGGKVGSAGAPETPANSSSANSMSASTSASDGVPDMSRRHTTRSVATRRCLRTKRRGAGRSWRMATGAVG
mmetsp:Transcript_77585/g.154071  ORF Transcript_77585/g.154071 Transcript_77585/m.154071 type:complete len:222 (+) Transcript_77585:201-866(+)